VGAGRAGLSAATDIAAAGGSVVVLEARDRVGGRTLTEELDGGHLVELGGQWIGPTQDRMYALVRDLGIETYPTYDAGDQVALLAGKRYRFSGKLPRLNPLVVADFAQGFYRLERMAKRIDPERPWRAERARDWDGQTVETWVRRHMRTPLARETMRLFVRALLTTEPSSLSLLFTLFYFRSGTSFENLVSTTGGAQQDRLVGGAHLVSTRLAERLGDRVVLRAPVRAIEHGHDVRVATDERTWSARRAIVAVPPALAATIAYAPALPGHRAQLTQRMPHGATIKSVAVYERPFWRDEGLSGQAGGLDLPVEFTFDTSPRDGYPGMLVGFVEGDRALVLGRMSADARRKLVLDSFARYFGPKAAEPIAYADRDWTEEEWTRGCFGGHMPPGALTRFGPALREPVGPIHWAGTESARVWAGYMEGAVESGRRAASEVLEALSRG
ncbi:MAG TPA: FAD-dependent oxidoreductase, partial [Actinomycetota bacterium]|nr:FAD-dependent oxidoreductase [Actinomycetota bacterium]